MPTEIKYGIVIDNNDINETGKIRLMLVEEIPPDYRGKNVSELKVFLQQQDNKNIYVPWSKSTGTKQADPYLAEPFMPKQLNLIPAEGQMVKVLLYDTAMYREYVGPVLSSLENQKESYNNAINAYRTQGKRNLITKGFTNKVNDFSLYGNNSQLVLGDKEVFLRTNQQDQINKEKNKDFTLFQQSSFNTSITLDRRTTQVTQTPEVVISHLLQVSYQKVFREFLNQQTVIATIQLMSVLDLQNANGTIGMTNNTYRVDETYNGNVELEFTLTTDDAANISAFVDELKTGILDRKLSMLATLQQDISSFTTTVTGPTYSVAIQDFRNMTRTHAEISDRKEVDVVSFIVRLDPAQQLLATDDAALEALGVVPDYKITKPKFYYKEQNNLVVMNQFTEQWASNSQVESKLLNTAPRVVTVVDDGVKMDPSRDSYTLQASKKILLMSTQVTPNLIPSAKNQYGLTQKDLANLVDPKSQNTYSTVRGEVLIQTMITMIDLFLAHGHSVMNTTKNSLEEDTKAQLSRLKEELTKKVNADLSGGPSLLNQYIRVN